MKNQENTEKFGKAGAAFGGRFAWFDLYCVLNRAFDHGLTGFVRVQWDVGNFTKNFKPSIAEKMAVGKATLFLNDGCVVDAVFGDSLTASSKSEKEFIDTLGLVIQISFGFGTEHQAEGESFVFTTDNNMHMALGCVGQTELIELVTESAHREAEWSETVENEIWADIIGD
jgi:hypothetical protein